MIYDKFEGSCKTFLRLVAGSPSVAKNDFNLIAWTFDRISESVNVSGERPALNGCSIDRFTASRIRVIERYISGIRSRNNTTRVGKPTCKSLVSS